MLPQKKTTLHALFVGKTQGKEVCYRRRYGKKKETQGTTRNETKYVKKQEPQEEG